MSSIKSFLYFKQNQKKIVIPQIQRDYAEGRMIGKVPDVRKSLLTDMIEAVCENKKIELDFVYGYEKDNCFEPLDGQQRLTTLFLLTWFLTTDLDNIKIDEESILTYKNRNTSFDFCNELVKHKAKEIINDYLLNKNRYPNLTLLEYIKHTYWFRYNWNFDSTIESMVVVINDIYEMMSKKSNYDYKNTDNLYSNLSNITFKLLDLDDFEMGDELYIKMNARGKELSSFDLLKSYLEQDLSKNNVNNVELLVDWQSKIDCNWMDYLWWKYYINSTDKNISLIEKNFETLLYIFIWYQILGKANSIQSLDKEIIAKELTNKSIDSIISIYKNLNFNINYKTLMQFFDSIFSSSNNQFIDLDSITQNIFHYSLISRVIENKEYDDLIYLYAAIKWRIGFRIDFNNLNSVDNNNFIDFLKFIRNIFKIENADTQRIDGTKDFIVAMNTVDNYINEFSRTSNISFMEFIASNIQYTKGLQVLEISIKEEKLKASLKLQDSNWKTAIDRAESNFYLNGQIYPLLHVEQNNVNRFNRVLNKFNSMIYDNDSLKNNGFKLLQLLMIKSTYVNCHNSSKQNTLIQLDFQRDFSLKHHLRDLNSCILDNFKNIMDDWINNFEPLSFVDYYNLVINNNINEINNYVYWRKFIVKNNRWYDSIEKICKHLTTICQNDNLYIKKNNGNEEIIIAHIHGVVKSNDNLYLLDDQSAPNRVAFLYNNTIEYCIENVDVNTYILMENNIVVLQNVDCENIINDLNNRISNIF